MGDRRRNPWRWRLGGLGLILIGAGLWHLVRAAFVDAETLPMGLAVGLASLLVLAAVIYGWEHWFLGPAPTPSNEAPVGDGTDDGSSPGKNEDDSGEHLRRQAFDALPIGLLIVAEDGRIELSNPPLIELLSLRHDPTGELLLDLPSGDALQASVDRAKEQSELIYDHLERLGGPRQPTTKQQLSILAVPFADLRVLLLLQDLTHSFRQLETHRELVANVSHELKTPLTAIRGYAETLNDGALKRPEVSLLFTQRILEQCKRLESVLHDLLVVARLEGEPATSEEPQAIDLGSILRRAMEVVAPQAEARNIDVVVDIPDDLPPILGHGNELEHMLLNLLDNSIKYNREGGRVAITMTAADDYLRLTLEDQGIGIPPQDLQRIFERFYRVDKGRSRGQGGTGLGLAIVHQIVERHHGTIEVESQLGAGSTFRVRLPFTWNP